LKLKADSEVVCDEAEGSGRNHESGGGRESERLVEHLRVNRAEREIERERERHRQ
jgi:hypothetical protein